MKRYFGCHVSAAGGLANAIKNGDALGVNTIQIHASPPQRWNHKPFPAGVELPFLEAKASSTVKKVFFHGVYLINLAALDPAKTALASRSLQFYLELMDRIGGDGVIFHVGSNRDQESEETGLRQSADAINRILEAAPGKSRLLLEVSAGSGRVIGDRMEELRQIYDMLENKERVGFALDTQHMWASGYDLAGRLEDVVNEIEHIFGLERVHAVHLNDSKTDLASRSDRHADLGTGMIGREALTAFINHQKLRAIPLILETPAMKDIESAAKEVETLRGMLQGG